LFDQIWRHRSRGNVVKARMSARAASRWSWTPGSFAATESRSLSYWACTDAASGWSYTLCSMALTAGQELFGQVDIRFAA
jgi:hypothetical protein